MGDKAKVPSKPIHCYQCTKKVRLANSLVEVDFCLSLSSPWLMWSYFSFRAVRSYLEKSSGKENETTATWLAWSGHCTGK